MSDCGFLDIKASHLLSSLVSISSAFLLGYWINVFLKTKHNRRDATVISIKEIELQIKDLNSKISTLPKEEISPDMVSFFTQLSVSISKLCIIVDLSSQRKIQEQLKSNFFNLKRLVTDVSKANPLEEKQIQGKISALQGTLNSIWFQTLK